MTTRKPNLPRRNVSLTILALVLGGIANMGGCPPELLNRADQLFGTNFNPPVILSVTPTSGSAAGGTNVTIRGLNFEDGTGVLFGDTAATSVKRTNNNLLEVVAPPGAPGPVDVTVIAGDTQSTVLDAGFEYLDDSAAEGVPGVTSVQPDRSSVLGGTRITINGSRFKAGTQVMFGSFIGTDVQVIDENQLQVTAPAQVAGKVDLMVRSPDGTTTTLSDGFEYFAIADADAEIIRQLETRFPGGPRVVSAVATDNTSVQVTFSEPVSLATGQKPGNYSIVIPEGGVLLLDPGVAPTLDPEQTTVDLTTLGMADASYRLTVSGIRDLAGNSLASPDILVNPTQTEFDGIPPATIGDQTDTDGDGLADWFEMLGWSINIELANGVRTQAYVTSNPFVADTDGDGLSDSEENARSLDPRTDDTDADLVSDWDEIHLYASNPTDQDTDNDGLADKTELQFKTSPTLADTDGDQLDDREELVIRNRNPRLSDLPIPQIVIGSTNVEIDERFTYTDEMGVQRSTESSTSSSFTQADTTTFSESNTRSNEATNTFNQSLQVGGEVGTEGWKVGGQVEVGFGQERGRGYTSTVSNESSQTTQAQYTDALSQALAVSQNQSVTRSVDDARVSADVTIVNSGDLAFTIQNLEISARVKDPRSRDRFLPMATLLPASGNSEYNLGPTGSQRGPFIFENTEIFPNLAQDLIREPRAVIFEIANYDIVDEYGRNFAFTLDEINDVTAGITIDFGDGRVESYRVATANTFDSNGIATGITMREALTNIIGLTEVNNEELLPAGTDLTSPAIRGSFGTHLGNHGEQILTRVRGVQTNLDSLDPAAKFWVVLSSADIPETADFGDLALHPGDNYMLWYVQDTDKDGLFAREEFMAGCSDSLVDTDGDGISDYDEVKNGWLLATPGNVRRVYAHPGRADTDLDGVPDDLERRLGMDPRSGDTDGDGLKDDVELNGYSVVLLDGDTDPNNNPQVNVMPYSDAVIIEPRNGGDGTAATTANPDSDDVQLVGVGKGVMPGQPVIGPGPDGIIDTTPEGDEYVSTKGPSIVATEMATAASVVATSSDDVQLIAQGDPVAEGDVVIGAGPDGVLQTMPSGTEKIRTPHRAMFASDPVLADTDADSLVDGREEFLGSRPNIRDADSVLDSDFDGLTNQQEMDGWRIGGTGALVTSDPNVADTDHDGLPDAIEWALLTNPRQRDTDGDGLNDIEEADLTNARGQFDDDRIAAAMARCTDAAGCDFTPAATPVGTDPVIADTDNDGLLDGVEVDGWQVRVSGQAIKNVTSDPFNANSDTDNLGDFEEYRGFDNLAPTAGGDQGDATDPRESDTDGDGVSDSRERDQNQTLNLEGTLKRSAVVPDQVIRIEYTGFQALGDCDNSSNEDYVIWGEAEIPTATGTTKLSLVNTNTLSGFPAGFMAYVDCANSCLTGQTGPTFAGDCDGSPPITSTLVTKHLDIGANEFVLMDGERYFVKPYDRTASLTAYIAEMDGSCGGSLTINSDFGAAFFEGNAVLDSGQINSMPNQMFERMTNSAGCNFELDYDVNVIP